MHTPFFVLLAVGFLLKGLKGLGCSVWIKLKVVGQGLGLRLDLNLDKRWRSSGVAAVKTSNDYVTPGL